MYKLKLISIITCLMITFGIIGTLTSCTSCDDSLDASGSRTRVQITQVNSGRTRAPRTAPPRSEGEGFLDDDYDDDYEPEDYVEEIELKIDQIAVVPRIAPRRGDMKESIVYDVNVLQVGADPTGRADSTEYINAALEAVGRDSETRSSGGTVYIPSGRYRITDTLNVPAGVNLIGDWVSPKDGGLGKGTILMVYHARGSLDEGEGMAVAAKDHTAVRDLTFWYPQQTIDNIVPYPWTVSTSGNATVANLTFINSYNGIDSNSSSCVTFRDIYGTFLNTGARMGNAGDVPRFEEIYHSPAYWGDSGLPGSPQGDDYTELTLFCRYNSVVIHQTSNLDWGIWYGLYVDHARIGYLTDYGNCSFTQMIMTNVDYGFYFENGAGGPMMSDLDIEANEAGIYFEEAPQNPRWLNVSSSRFGGNPKYGIQTKNKRNFVVSLNATVFENWQIAAVLMEGSTLLVSNSHFKQDSVPFIVTNDDFKRAIILGSTFAYTADEMLFEPTIRNKQVRDDEYKDVPSHPVYEYEFAPRLEPSVKRVFNVMDYGARPIYTNDDHSTPAFDNTAAFQKALDAAGKAGGGFVVVPAGTFRLDGFITVPTNVELRGTNENKGGLSTVGESSVLLAYGGKRDICWCVVDNLAECRPGCVGGAFRNIDNELYKSPTATPEQRAQMEADLAFNRALPQYGPLLDDIRVAGQQAFITLSPGSGARGISVGHPEQGHTLHATLGETADSDVGTGDVDEEMHIVQDHQRVKEYPPVIRGDRNTWIYQVGSYNPYYGYDFMTNNSSGSVAADFYCSPAPVTISVGHGTRGFYYQDLQTNASIVTQRLGMQGLMERDDVTWRDFTGGNGAVYAWMLQNAVGIRVGDVKDSKFFTSFQFGPMIGTELVKDAFTGGSADMVTLAVNYDGARDGIVGRDGSTANITSIQMMGVIFGKNPRYPKDHKNHHGYLTVTEPGFNGDIAFDGMRVWSGNSHLSQIRGGRVTYNMGSVDPCATAADNDYANVTKPIKPTMNECYGGGTLNMFNLYFSDLSYSAYYNSGAKGIVAGNANRGNGASDVVNIFSGSSDVVFATHTRDASINLNGRLTVH
ncbi:MAG: glycoside hydrolase family 55 protein [Oscillospiraceae bacterium]|nr:glycoside hydrolase family 55 protein [Oscillospiraceae bacterium]